jgi:transcriptional regulator with XRE-family HTH domain
MTTQEVVMAGTGTGIRTLKQARTARMLTVRGLAAAAGVSLAAVHEVETGKRRPRFGTIQRLSAALGVAPESIAEFRAVLFGEEERA